MGTLLTFPAADTLAQALQQIWASNAPLVAKLPTDRCLTGRVPPSMQMPYCRLELSGGSEQQLTNGNEYYAAAVVFHVWSDSFDDGDAIAPLVRAAFANLAFDWSSGGCLRLKPEGPLESKQTDDPEIKAWETVVRFTATISEPRQD